MPPDLAHNPAPFASTNRRTVTLAPAVDTTPRPITRGPYVRRLTRAELVEIARANTRRLTGRDTY